MAILNFSDVLKNVGLDPKRVKLIRHSLGDKAFKKCYDKNMVEEYTRVQSETFSNGYEYWCVFISDKSTTAKFFACYKEAAALLIRRTRSQRVSRWRIGSKGSECFTIWSALTC